MRALLPSLTNELCGLTATFSIVHKGLFADKGSVSNTSNAANKSLRSSKTSHIACSSIRPPRAMFTSIAFCFIVSSTSRLIKPRVEGSKGAVTTTTSNSPTRPRKFSVKSMWLKPEVSLVWMSKPVVSAPKA